MPGKQNRTVLKTMSASDSDKLEPNVVTEQPAAESATAESRPEGGMKQKTQAQKSAPSECLRIILGKIAKKNLHKSLEPFKGVRAVTPPMMCNELLADDDAVLYLREFMKKRACTLDEWFLQGLEDRAGKSGQKNGLGEGQRIDLGRIAKKNLLKAMEPFKSAPIVTPQMMFNEFLKDEDAVRYLREFMRKRASKLDDWFLRALEEAGK